MKSGEELAEAFAAAYPELAEVAAAAPDPVYLVGGAVRDLLLGRGRADIDLVVEGDPAALAAALGCRAAGGALALRHAEGRVGRRGDRHRGGPP